MRYGKISRCRIHAVALACFAVGIAASAVTVVAAKQKLRFWVPAEYTWNQMASKFEKENPNVDIDVVSGNLDKLYTMITAGLMPDVWGPWDTPGITADVNRNWALDLTPFITRDGKSMNISDFFPGLMKSFKVKGKVYSLPIFYYIDWYFYDTQKYAQAGLVPPPVNPNDRSWTWEQMVSNAQKITKYDSKGQVSQPGLEFGRSFDNWRHLWGAKLYDEEGLKSSIPQRIYLDTPQMTEALTKAWELIYRYKVAKPTAAAMAWSNKQTASSIEGGWNIKFIMPIKGFKWSLAPLPYARTNAGTTWPDGWRIAKNTKNKELAWKFVRFLCAPENMRIIVSDQKSNYKGTGVARKSVFSDTMAEDISKVNGMRPADILRIYEGADEVGIVKESDTICLHTDISRTYLEPILTDLWANKVAPKEAAVRLQSQANKGLPILFTRWLRNIKFTGADKVK